MIAGISCFLFSFVLFFLKDKYANQKALLFFLIFLGIGSFFRALFWIYHDPIFLKISMMGFLFTPLIITIFIENFFSKHFSIVFKLYILIGLIFLLITTWTNNSFETWWLCTLNGYISFTLFVMLLYAIYKAVTSHNKSQTKNTILMAIGIAICLATMLTDLYAILHASSAAPRLGIGAAMIAVYMACLIYGTTNIPSIKNSLRHPILLFLAAIGLLNLLSAMYPELGF